MSNSNLIEYKVTLDEVTKTGFTYTITVNFNSKFKSLYVRWASVNDTHVEV